MTTEKTAIALRVLTAINHKQEPDPKDVVILRSYCPEGRALDVDEVACIVIQGAMREKREKREHAWKTSQNGHS